MGRKIEIVMGKKLQVQFLNGLEILFGQFNCLFELIVFPVMATSPMFYNK